MKFVVTHDVEVVYRSGRRHIYPNVSDLSYEFVESENIGYFILSSSEFKSHQRCIDAPSVKSIGYVVHSCD